MSAELADVSGRPTLRERSIELMERCLRGGEPLAEEYPLVFAEGAPGRSLCLEEAGEPRSACAALPRDLFFGGRRLPVGLIGSVVTDPAWRGRGLMGRLLDRVEEELRAEGCLLALLWAEDPLVYTSRGYRPFAWEVDHLLVEGHLERLLDGEGVRPAAPGDALAIHDLYARHAERVGRSPAETAALLSCPGMSCLIRERDGQIAAYACMGRGADLQGAVHEWGGEADAALPLVRRHLEAALAAGAEGIAVMSSPGCRLLHDLLEGIGATRFDGIVGLAKVIDAEGLAGLAADLLGADEGLLTADELLELCFPPRGDPTLRREMERVLGRSLDTPPHQPFVWGFDSI